MKSEVEVAVNRRFLFLGEEASCLGMEDVVLNKQRLGDSIVPPRRDVRLSPSCWRRREVAGRPGPDASWKEEGAGGGGGVGVGRLEEEGYVIGRYVHPQSGH